MIPIHSHSQVRPLCPHLQLTACRVAWLRVHPRSEGEGFLTRGLQGGRLDWRQDHEPTQQALGARRPMLWSPSYHPTVPPSCLRRHR